MNGAQEALLKEIQEERARPAPNRNRLASLARQIASYDDRTADLKHHVQYGVISEQKGRKQVASFTDVEERDDS